MICGLKAPLFYADVAIGGTLGFTAVGIGVNSPSMIISGIFGVFLTVLLRKTLGRMLEKKK